MIDDSEVKKQVEALETLYQKSKDIVRMVEMFIKDGWYDHEDSTQKYKYTKTVFTKRIARLKEEYKILRKMIDEKFQ